MRKRALLVLAVALLIAAAGVVYAHWMETLTVDATVNTGEINVIWQEWGTDDDGIVGNDPSGNDTGVLTALYDHWGDTSSSADPAEMWRCGSGTCAYKLDVGGEGWDLARYDKDVGRCTVTASTDFKTLTASVENAYPSYHCTVFSQLSNEGSVPVKMTAFRLTAPGVVAYVGTEFIPAAAGTTAWCNDPVNAGRCPLGVWTAFPGGVPVMTFDFADGTACGNQLDPYVDEGDDMDLNAVWFHVEQNAAENTSYAFNWEYDFVNWNEWDPSMCTIHINGAQVYP